MSHGPQRKRPRPNRPSNVPSQNIDIPTIPGVPSNVTALLIQALGSATQYVQQHGSHSHAVLLNVRTVNPFQDDQELSPYDQRPLSSSSALQHPSSVMDSILNRIVVAAPNNDEPQKRVKRQESMQNDCRSWINALSRERRHEDQDYPQAGSVDLACFRYIWDLGQQHGRVAVRRAALFLAGCLLTQSEECRLHLAVTDEHALLAWVSCLSEASPLHSSWKNSEQAARQIPLWQSEAYQWLTLLSEEYGHLYPKFRVAQRFLQQRCPSILVETKDHEDDDRAGSTTTLSNMPDLRRVRDMAMRHGANEIEKVEKLIRRANACFDILVPRIGASDGPRIGASYGNQAVGIDGQESDEDEAIDWEDGEDDIHIGEGDKVDDHARAVEQTLAVMEMSGGLLGGSLDILFTAKADDEESPEQITDGQTRRVAYKTVQSLTKRMPRLSSWVDALVQADGLILQGLALVVMPVDMARKRGELLQSLQRIKRAAATVMLSCKRIGISEDSHGSSSSSSQIFVMDSTSAVSPSSLRERSNTMVVAGAARPRVNTSLAPRRSKLHIKYRKTVC